MNAMSMQLALIIMDLINARVERALVETVLTAVTSMSVWRHIVVTRKPPVSILFLHFIVGAIQVSLGTERIAKVKICFRVFFGIELF